jgi:hypothetical protein
MIDDWTGELPEMILRGKYTKWAESVDDRTLLAIYWFLGEILVRTRNTDFSAATYEARVGSANDPAKLRKDVAMEALYEIYQGKRYSDGFNEITDRLWAGVYERQHLADEDAKQGRTSNGG